jgi:hypothetical protein
MWRRPYFLEKVSDTSFPRFPVFGGTLQDRFRSDFSPRGKISVTLSENSYFQQQSFSHGSTILSTTGLYALGWTRQAKRDRHKLVNFVVPDKSEKFPGSQRNWDMEISIRKVQFGGQHTWKNTSSDRYVGLHFAMGNQKVTVQNREITRFTNFWRSRLAWRLHHRFLLRFFRRL